MIADNPSISRSSIHCQFWPACAGFDVAAILPYLPEFCALRTPARPVPRRGYPGVLLPRRPPLVAECAVPHGVPSRAACQQEHLFGEVIPLSATRMTFP